MDFWLAATIQKIKILNVKGERNFKNWWFFGLIFIIICFQCFFYNLTSAYAISLKYLLTFETRDDVRDRNECQLINPMVPLSIFENLYVWNNLHHPINPMDGDFQVPDTVCTGSPVIITNFTQGGTTFYWTFCSGSANNNPSGVNIGNPGGLLSIPTYITLVKQGNDCFSFISCQGVGVIRYFHGNSFRNNPISWTNLGTFGLIQFSEEGIQVKYDNGAWYGFINSYLTGGNSTIIRLNFGSSLWNIPTASDIGPVSEFVFGHGLIILKEGNSWVGFVVGQTSNNLVRIDFGNSLSSVPSFIILGTLGVLNSPYSICLIQENSMWYGLVTMGNNSLARLAFGTSLLNTPSAQNLGNPGGYFNYGLGLTLLRDCEATTGYWVNYQAVGQLGKLSFPFGIAGGVNGQLLGNIGNLSYPHSFSELFRQNDTLYAYITNRGNGTLTRLTFPPCNNSSVPSSALFNPPSFTYNSEGTFNIQLIVDEGLPTMTSICKPIVVMNQPLVYLGDDQAICQGSSLVLDAGPNFSSYFWSTGATTRTITVSNAGSYYVVASRWGCSSSDTINISSSPIPIVDLGPDDTICEGQEILYDAGFCVGCSYVWSNLTTGQLIIGSTQTYTANISGIYSVVATNTQLCTRSDTVQLYVNPPVNVDISIVTDNDTVCASSPVVFTVNAGNPGNQPIYDWFVNGLSIGSQGSAYSYIPVDGDCVNCRITSNVQCPIGNPTFSNTICITVLPSVDIGISISSSENPVCYGTNVIFIATTSNAGSSPQFHWNVNGITVGSDSSIFEYYPINGDCVSCKLSSNSACVSNSPIMSNNICMIVHSLNQVSNSISASSNPVCFGSPVTLESHGVNQGTVPVYQWYINGLLVGGHNPFYTYTPSMGDTINCVLWSNENCIIGNPAISNTLVMSIMDRPVVIFTPCFDTTTTLNAKPFKLRGGTPLGGIYSGEGVNSISGQFAPLVIGNITVSYTYINSYGCTGTSIRNIAVWPPSPFICGNTLNDIRDFKKYPTILFGDQCWMAGNLSHGIFLLQNISQRDNCLAEYYCYNNIPSGCDESGGLYQWDEVMQYCNIVEGQGICPPEWHVPSEIEWLRLFNFFAGNAFAADPLKSSGFSGFNSLLEGAVFFNQNPEFQNFATFFWSSSTYGTMRAWSHSMNRPDPSVSSYPALIINALSIRCISD